jgi:hypothetical protein
MHLTESFAPLLAAFRDVFTQPTYATFVALMTGWILTHRHRFVTELIQSSGSTHHGHHSRYHRFFSHAAWCLDTLCCVLARLVVATFVPVGLIEVAVDDTLCRKRGLTIYGTGMHYDPLLSSRALKRVSWGHDWVVLSILIRRPWAPTKVWALPVLCRLYRNRQGRTKGQRPAGKGSRVQGRKRKRPADPSHRTRPELARELIQLLASWFPQREFLLSGDSAYGGGSVLRHLPANVGLLSRVAANAALYAPAPVAVPGAKTSGRPRKKGERLPGLVAWAADREQHWEELGFDQFGLHATLWVKTRQALYYKAGKDRLLRIVLVHDPQGKRPDQMFFCTRLDWDARQILGCYANRWAIEVTFENCKQLLGLEDPANRVPKAVSRTAALALVIYSLIIVWFDRVGYAGVRFPERRWYRQKREPSFADMLSTLRRQSWEEVFAGVPLQSTLAKTKLAQLIDFVSRSG